MHTFVDFEQKYNLNHFESHDMNGYSDVVILL